jgi:hypothetical protein
MQMDHLECLAEYEEYESFTLGFGGGGEYLDALDFVGRTAAAGPSTSVGKGGNAVGGAGAGSGSGSGSGSTTLRDKGSSGSEGKGKGKEPCPDPHVIDGSTTKMNGFHPSAAVDGDNDNDLYLRVNNGPIHVFDLVSERLLSDTYDDDGIRESAPETGSKSGSGSGAGAATRRTVTLNKWRERVVDSSDSCPPKKEGDSENARGCGEWEREVVWVGIGGKVWDEYPGRRKLRMRMQKMTTTPIAGEEGDGSRSDRMKETGTKDVWPGVSASRSRSKSGGLEQEAKSTGTGGKRRTGTATATATTSASGEYHDDGGNVNEEGKARGKAKAGYGRAVSISPSCFFLLKRVLFC